MAWQRQAKSTESLKGVPIKCHLCAGQQVTADVLKDEIKLQADNVTRWNSQLKMI